MDKVSKRAPVATPPKREVDPIKRQLAAIHNQQKATALDLRWRAKFGERMASYKQAIWRITGGIECAIIAWERLGSG